MVVVTAYREVETSCLPSGRLPRTWIAAATRAHNLLTHSLSDESLDAISAGHVLDPLRLQLPAYLAG